MSMIKDYLAERTGLLEAIEYAERGWAVMPLQAKSKKPHFTLAPRAYLSATTDLDTIESWYAHGRDLNLGIAAAPSGLVIVDIDRRTLDDHGHAKRLLLPETYTVETADGWHLYYLDEGRSYAGKIANGLEVKHRGYVAAPPSVHPTGIHYTVALDIDPVPFPVSAFGKSVVR